MEEVIDIAAMEKQYQGEWLLFEVLESDGQDQPVRGRLLCHHKNRDFIHQKDVETRSPHAYITYAGPVLPEGVEAAM